MKTDFPEFPRFLRFSEVVLDYFYAPYQYAESNKVIEEKCQSVVNYLQSQKRALNDTTLIHFVCAIDKNDLHNFNNHSQLINHLQTELMPIFGSSRAYKFSISFYSEAKACTELIASILQIDPIKRCSALEIIFPKTDQQVLQVPVEAISNWLHRKHDVINGVTKERLLKICSSEIFIRRHIQIQNAMEMCDYLKEVVKI